MAKKKAQHYQQAPDKGRDGRPSFKPWWMAQQPAVHREQNTAPVPAPSLDSRRAWEARKPAPLDRKMDITPEKKGILDHDSYDRNGLGSSMPTTRAFPCRPNGHRNMIQRGVSVEVQRVRSGPASRFDGSRVSQWLPPAYLEWLPPAHLNGSRVAEFMNTPCASMNPSLYLIVVAVWRRA